MARSTPSCGWRKRRRPALSEQDRQGGARDRLAHISHHFLSDKEETAPPFRLTLLGATPCTTLLRPALAQALCRLAVPAVHLPAAEDGVCATYKRSHTPPEEAVVALTLLMQETADLPAPDRHGRLLLMVGSTPPELEQAYLFCKQLLASRHALLPGITFTHCPGRQQAEQCFYQLAGAVQRFLGQPLLSYTYLPPAEPDHSTWRQQVLNLADLIAADWRQHCTSSTATTTDIGRT
ncbi:MAG: hypothetical protein ACE5ET_09650 [Gammaproteobacteria bacterium]